MVLDVEDLPEFNRIFIFGVLEFDVQGAQDLKLSATHIFISGGRLIMGWPVRVEIIWYFIWGGGRFIRGERGGGGWG